MFTQHIASLASILSAKAQGPRKEQRPWGRGGPRALGSGFRKQPDSFVSSEGAQGGAKAGGLWFPGARAHKKPSYLALSPFQIAVPNRTGDKGDRCDRQKGRKRL